MKRANAITRDQEGLLEIMQMLLYFSTGSLERGNLEEGIKGCMPEINILHVPSPRFCILFYLFILQTKPKRDYGIEDFCDLQSLV